MIRPNDNVTAQQIRELFGDFGTVTDVHIVRDRDTQEQLMAFVELDTQFNAADALKGYRRNGTWGGHIEWARPHRKLLQEQRRERNEVTTVRFGGVPRDLRWDVIKRRFAKFVPVQYVYVDGTTAVVDVDSDDTATALVKEFDGVHAQWSGTRWHIRVKNPPRAEATSGQTPSDANNTTGQGRRSGSAEEDSTKACSHRRKGTADTDGRDCEADMDGKGVQTNPMTPAIPRPNTQPASRQHSKLHNGQRSDSDSGQHSGHHDLDNNDLGSGQHGHTGSPHCNLHRGQPDDNQRGTSRAYHDGQEGQEVLRGNTAHTNLHQLDASDLGFHDEGSGLPKVADHPQRQAPANSLLEVTVEDISHEEYLQVPPGHVS